MGTVEDRLWTPGCRGCCKLSAVAGVPSLCAGVLKDDDDDVGDLELEFRTVSQEGWSGSLLLLPSGGSGSSILC